MKIITVATHSQAYFPVLQESAKRHGIGLIVLGWGQKWSGFGWKLQQLKNYLDSLPQDEIIVVLDAFDTLISSNIGEIEKKFGNINTNMLCASERKHHSYIFNLAYEKIFNNRNGYPQTPTPYIYLNAGAWISFAGYALNLLKMVNIKNTTNDQELFTYLYLNGYISIDYGCEIFTCIREENDLLYINQIFQNKFTKTYPCIIHAPADVSMKKITSLLGYSPINYNLKQRAWKYIYSTCAFFGNKSFKKCK